MTTATPKTNHTAGASAPGTTDGLTCGSHHINAVRRRASQRKRMTDRAGNVNRKEIPGRFPYVNVNRKE